MKSPWLPCLLLLAGCASGAAHDEDDDAARPLAQPAVFQLDDVLAERARLGQPYHEFFTGRELKTAVYVLPEGATDMQQPHAEDELYVVLSGRARFQCNGHDQQVTRGSVLFVPAQAVHRFHAIEQRLELLVIFAR